MYESSDVPINKKTHRTLAIQIKSRDFTFDEEVSNKNVFLHFYFFFDKR